MIEGNFDPRTMANMVVALDRICDENPRGGQHQLRKKVAREILKCARRGKTTLGELVAAGQRALIGVPASTAKRVRPAEPVSRGPTPVASLDRQ
jgi:hypothetical protein